MNILLAGSEALPYSKTGGLADMVGALAKFLARAGHEVRLVTPLYRGLRVQFPDIQPIDWRLDLPLGSHRVQGRVWIRTVDERLAIYFIEQPQFFERSDIYQERGLDYPDNAERFIWCMCMTGRPPSRPSSCSNKNCATAGPLRRPPA